MHLNYPNFEVIVVDQNSSDGTANAIEKIFPEIKLIKNKENLGRTGGYNTGFNYAQGDYILCLDHDTVVHEDMLTELVKVAEKGVRIGAVGPKIYYYNDPNRLWSIGEFVSLKTGRSWSFGYNEIDKGQFEKSFVVQIYPTAILVKRKVMNLIGGFDDIFFAVYCDSDFCVRIYEAGYIIVSVPKAKLWHKVLKPSGVNYVDNKPTNRKLQELGFISQQRAFLSGRNRIIFMKKHSKCYFVSFFLFLLPAYSEYYTVQILRNQRADLLKAYWRGILEGTKFALGPKKKKIIHAF
jgi:hypothetical protein